MLELEETSVIYILNFTHEETEPREVFPEIIWLVMAETWTSEGQHFVHLMLFICFMEVRTEIYV